VIVPDISINEISTDDKYDVVIVPGGDKGSNAMSKNLAVGNLLQQHYTNGKLVAAICAGMILERKNSRIWFFFVKVH
jgi:putative intracellular protease/amidase